MQGTKLAAAKALERGFEHDRRFMLIDENGNFISQRTHPNLVFFTPEIKNDVLLVHYKERTLQVSLSEHGTHKVSTTIFDATVQATEVNDEANEWFSAIFGQKIRLVKMEDSDVRLKSLKKGPEKVEVSFADGYPYLIVGTASLDHLNTQLDEPLLMDRFRPNIVLTTNEPHIEDTLESISIGGTQFLVVKPCARCQVITVDQKSGTKSKEPLKTLSSYRKINKKIYFGANAICRNVSDVHIGDEVIIL